ncbi:MULTISPECIES: M56 family metallopeptidase [unclassified Bacillus cereus group]|uniref:M56 family metallopeptidase n=1 Tax=unclassified Bacillus cereus group TaxID=2750818 RepID=UPI001F581B3B|nr:MULTISPECIES: M56 family metallopeptidase [unclassified Bacillus cereus group]
MLDTFTHIYLSRFFDWVIETSLMASILVGIILCVKIVLKDKLTPRWQYVLWMILVVRLLLPWSPDSSYNIYSLFYQSEVSEVFPKQSSSTTLQKSVQENEEFKGALEIPDAAHTMNQKEEQKEATFSMYNLALYIWLFGVSLLAIVTFVMNGRLYFYIKKQPYITKENIMMIFENCRKSVGIRRNIPICVAGKISSPTVFGFFRPRVLLSNQHIERLNEKQLEYIFYHELAHIKRRDVAVNWLMYSLLILNWFNPILWYAYSCMREDQELACDALALTFVDSEEQIAYGHTIITLLEHYSGYYQAPSLANLSRNKHTLKRRIFMIKKFKKTSYRLSALGVIVVVAVAFVSLLNLNVRATEVDQSQKEKVLEKKKQSKAAFEEAIDRILGTPENASREWGMAIKTYKYHTDFLYLAEKCLTKEEFNQYVQLYKETFQIYKKAMVEKKVGENYEGDTKEFKRERLSKADNERLTAIEKKSKPFEDRVGDSLTFTVEEAQKHVKFPIKQPSYTSDGYELKKESANSYFGRDLELVVTSEYRKGKYGYTIYQSGQYVNNKDPLRYMFPWDENMENYELEGNQIVFVKPPSYSNSKLKGMKVFVHESGKNIAHQIVIVNDIFTRGEADYEEIIDEDLTKKEMEKILLSMLK